MYAVQFLRWLFECGVAGEIGPACVTLLSAVVLKEDAVHYTRAVDFYNGQLAEKCGFRSEDTMASARKRAVDEGLLYYEQGKKRRPGKYFVLGFTPNSREEIRGNAGETPGKVRGKSGPPNPIPSNPVTRVAHTPFSPPTVDEVRAYCRERGNRVNPQRFVDHYEANGWRQSRGNKIRDWKAAVRTWESNNLDPQPKIEKPVKPIPRLPETVA
jgi:hypothetical protein